MNCPNCGKESVEGAKFCESCGAPLVSEVSEPAAPVPPAPASPFNAPEPSMPIGTNTAQSSVPQAPAQTQSGYAPYEPPAQPYGTQNGYDIALTKAVSSAVNVPVIASGGAGKLEDFYDVLAEGGADAVLAASVFHYKTFTIKQVKEYLRSRGIEVRL